MNYSRRNLALLLPALAAAQAAAPEKRPVLASKTYNYPDLQVRKGESSRQNPVFDGTTTHGVPLEVHITELEPGKAPHAPHRHAHEEMIFVREGNLEVTISGRTSRIGTGSVAFVASNEEHGWRNVGTTKAQYFVLAVGRTD